MKSLLNKSAVREYALEQSKQLRNGRFTRVGAEFFVDLEAYLKAIICNKIHRHPSVGKTLKG